MDKTSTGNTSGKFEGDFLDFSKFAPIIPSKMIAPPDQIYLRQSVVQRLANSLLKDTPKDPYGESLIPIPSLSDGEHILNRSGYIARHGYFLGENIRRWRINTLKSNADILHSTADLIWNTFKKYEEKKGEDLDICRGTTLRIDITVFLANYAEYLILFGDIEFAKIWYNRALYVAEILSARQPYFDLQVLRFSRFSEENMGQDFDIKAHAGFLRKFATDAHEQFYGLTDGQDDKIKHEKQMRTKRNFNQAGLIELFAYFHDIKIDATNSQEFEKNVAKFEEAKSDFAQSLKPGNPLTNTYDIGDAKLFHKIEYLMTQELSRSKHDSELTRKYTTSAFWLPALNDDRRKDGVGELQIQNKSMAIWCISKGRDSVDMRLPLIQALSLSLEFSQTVTHPNSYEQLRKDLIYRIAKSMAYGSFPPRKGIADFFSTQSKDAEVSGFATLLTLTGSIHGVNMAVDYLVSLLENKGKYLREFFNEAFLDGVWTVEYCFTRDKKGAAIIIDSHDIGNPKIDRIVTSGNGVMIGDNLRIVGKLSPAFNGIFQDKDVMDWILKSYESKMPSINEKYEKEISGIREDLLQILGYFTLQLKQEKVGSNDKGFLQARAIDLPHFNSKLNDLCNFHLEIDPKDVRNSLLYDLCLHRQKILEIRKIIQSLILALGYIDMPIEDRNHIDDVFREFIVKGREIIGILSMFLKDSE